MSMASLKRILGIISFVWFVASTAGESIYEIILEPNIIPFAAHLNLQTRKLSIVPNNPGISTPMGTIKLVDDYENENDIPNQTTRSSNLHLIIQDDRRTPRFSEYDVDLKEDNVVISVGKDSPIAGELIFTPNGFVFFDKAQRPFIWWYEKGYLWIDASHDSLQEVSFLHASSSIPKRIWYGGNIPPRLCTDKSEEYNNGEIDSVSWHLWLIPVCVARGTETLLDVLPNFMAKQVILATDNLATGIVVGRWAGFLLNVSILIFCIVQAFRQQNEVNIILYFIAFGYVLIAILNSILN